MRANRFRNRCLFVLLLGIVGIISNAAKGQTKILAREEVDVILEKANGYRVFGEYTKMEEQYLYVYDNTRLLPGFSATRLSFVLGYIVIACENIDDDCEKLRERRDINKERILAGTETYLDYQELVAINEQLGEEQDTLAVYDALRQQGDDRKEDIEKCGYYIWEELYDTGRVEEICEISDAIAASIARVIFEVGLREDFPGSKTREKTIEEITRNANEQLKLGIIGRGGKVYGVLLACGRLEPAIALETRMIQYDDGPEMQHLLLCSAKEAEDEISTSRLLETMKQNLKEEEYRELIDGIISGDICPKR